MQSGKQLDYKQKLMTIYNIHADICIRIEMIEKCRDKNNWSCRKQDEKAGNIGNDIELTRLMNLIRK